LTPRQLSLADLANIWYNLATMINPLPVLPSITDWKLADMRALCQRITGAVTPVTLAGHRLVVHDVHPHQLASGYTVRDHIHSFYEAHIVLDGAAMYTTGTPQPLIPGSALLHGPHSPHTWQTENETCLRLLFWFTLEPVVLPPADIKWPVWPDLLWETALLLRDVEAADPGWQQRATARIVLVLSRLLSLANWPDEGGFAEETEPTLVEMVEQFFHDNLTAPLGLEDIADHMGISIRSLCRQFQQLAGTTVMERLLTLRMERAAVLLTGNSEKLSVIAEQVGIPEQSYFCRCFRRYYHVSPKEYRKQMG